MISTRKTLNFISSIILRTICLFLLPSQHFVYSKSGDTGNSSSDSSNSNGSSTNGRSGSSTTSTPPRSSGGSSSSWVFWYYASDGTRECGNICKIVFAFVGIIALGIILAAIFECYLIHTDAKKRRQAGGDLESATSTMESLPQIDGHLQNKAPKTETLAKEKATGGILPVSAAGSKPYEFEYRAKNDESPVKIEQKIISFNPPFRGNHVTVQTNLPLHSSWSTTSQETGKKIVLRYYEVTVRENFNPTQTTLAVGLATKPHPNDSPVGWARDSIAYHSITGYLHNHSQGGETYGESFGKVGDVIGCGYYPDAGTLFFTKNGEWIGIGATGLKEYDWYPTISADGSLKVLVNFGDMPGSDFLFRPNESGWTKQ